MANDLRIGYLSMLLLSMTVYNSQIVLLRIFFVLMFSITPIFFAIQFKNNLKKNELNYLFLWSFLCFIYVMYSLISILINSNTFSLSLVGPSAEFLTPFLIFSSPFIYLILSSSSEYVLKESIKVFFVLLVVYLLVDLVMRYLQEPDCFMNYSCRQQAKTVGLFSTTNVIGTFVLYIFFALDRFKLPFLKYFLVIILFTGMARASIVTLIFIMMIKPIFNSNMIFKILSILFVIAFSTTVYLINPLGLFDDGSLLSKFDFLNAAFLSAQNATFLELFFGFGASFERITEVVSVQGYSPHAPYLKAYFYFGLIGLFLYITLNAFFLIKNFNFFFLIILASLINGFAGAPIYNPTIWVTFALYLIYCHSSQRTTTSYT